MTNKYITPDSRIRIEWFDLPENYTAENKSKIKTKIAKEYGIDKSQIDISFISSKKNDQGEWEEITNSNLDNILDTNYQHSLFKIWLDREGITTDYDTLIGFDKVISGDLVGDYEQSKFNKWSLSWLKINNFLAYGKNNNLNVDKLNGLTVISSEPANQGGKTSLIIDAILFLFIGKTTKTDKNEEIFNRYSEDDTLAVKGLINLGGDRYVIERKLYRTAKRSGGYTINSDLKYYRYMPDGTEQNLTEEQSIETTKEIKKMVGNEEIFNLSILTTGDNLMSLITGKPTENGKLLNKLVGLGVIEEKEAIARAKYNEWKKTKLSNRYSVVTLLEENTNAEENIELYNTLLETHNSTFETLNEQKRVLEETKETHIRSLKQIGVDINKGTKESIENNIAEIKSKGVEIVLKINNLNAEIAKLADVIYDEVKYSDTSDKRLAEMSKLNELNVEYKQLEHTIEHLENGEFCQSCHQPLPNVDNSKQIKELKQKVKATDKLITETQNEIKELDTLLANMRSDKDKYDVRNKSEIERDRLCVERDMFKLEFNEKKHDLKQYLENEDAIKHNKEVQLKIDVINTDLAVNSTSIKNIQDKIRDISIELTRKQDLIKNNLELIDKLNAEEKLENIYSTYIKMVGRNGITKIVVRSIVPLINAELERIMEDSLDIKLNLEINDKNEVELNIIDDDIIRPAKSGSGYEKTVSSLALRVVLSKISQLPSPNFIVFDEIFGKVSPDNYEKMYLFFNKIKYLFDTMFLIVHDERLKDWGDHHVLVKKTKKISQIIEG